eukprot:3213628-Pyramimonas_sp.AAC.1
MSRGGAEGVRRGIHLQGAHVRQVVGQVALLLVRHEGGHVRGGRRPGGVRLRGHQHMEVGAVVHPLRLHVLHREELVLLRGGSQGGTRRGQQGVQGGVSRGLGRGRPVPPAASTRGVVPCRPPRSGRSPSSSGGTRRDQQGGTRRGQ